MTRKRRCGSFRMPDTAGGRSTENAYPLTLRYVGGQLRFLGQMREQGGQGVYSMPMHCYPVN